MSTACPHGAVIWAVGGPQYSPEMVLFAHAGHWALWVLYAIPVVIVLVASAQALIRERRERNEQS